VLPAGNLTVQGLVQRLASLGIALALGACASTPPPGPPVTVLPGIGKDLAAFQQDELICQQHEVAHTGYGSPAGSAATGSPTGTPGSAANRVSGNGTAGTTPVAGGTTAANTAVPVGTHPFDEVGYLQCMASRGDTVQLQPEGYPAAYLYGDSYVYGYPYAYAYDYGYPYGFYDPGFVGVFDFGRGFHHGFHHHGFHHGGFGHGGFGHGGFGHGGGGHR
jgi:hypothetical protein